jgi:GT2 family glycosyltransferase
MYDGMTSPPVGSSTGRTAGSGTSSAEPGKRATILLVVVCYDGEVDVRRLLQEQSVRQSTVDVVTLIVDNGTRSSGSIAALADLHCPAEGVHVMSPGTNLGYFGGARWALEQYLETNYLPLWVVVCNPDIALVPTDFFGRLVRLHGSAEPMVVGPTIISSRTRNPQAAFMSTRPSATRMHLYKLIYSSRCLASIYELGSRALLFAGSARRWALRARRNGDRRRRVIYACHGSFMIFNHSYFERGGGLAHGAFLFGEEVFVAESVRRLRGQIVYEPELRVIHRGRSSTSYFQGATMHEHLRRATAYVADEFFT